MENERTHRQIMGTEIEWNIGVGRVGRQNKGMFVSLDSGNCNTWAASQLVGEYLPENIKYVGSLQNNNFLSNGGRYYIDVGTHPEYATPENSTAKGLVLSELAGERIVAHSLYRMLQHNEHIEEIVAMKRAIDPFGEANGYHLNVSEERQSFDRENIKDSTSPLIWHYASSLPMLGAGTVERYANGPDKDSKDPMTYRYSWGQRVLRIENDINGNTTRNRPFINTRDETLGDAQVMRRVHIVGVDPHILEWPAWMLFGTTSLMLAAARQGRTRKIEAPMLKPDYATAVAKQATYDLDDAQKYEVVINGKTKHYTTVEINELCWEDASKVVGQTGEQKKVLTEWASALEDRKNNVMNLNGRSDAVTKLARIMGRQARSDRTNFDESDLMVTDQNYTTIFRAKKADTEKYDAKTLYEKSPAATIRKHYQSAVVGIDEHEKEKAVTEPPRTTRAHIRGYLIRNREALRIKSADWTMCKAVEEDSDGNEKEIIFKFEPSDGAPQR
jgi:proteasome accessory factor A